MGYGFNVAEHFIENGQGELSHDVHEPGPGRPGIAGPADRLTGSEATGR